MIYPSYTAAPASPPSAGQAVRGTASRPAAYPECGGKIQRPNIKKNSITLWFSHSTDIHCFPWPGPRFIYE